MCLKGTTEGCLGIDGIYGRWHGDCSICRSWPLRRRAFQTASCFVWQQRLESKDSSFFSDQLLAKEMWWVKTAKNADFWHLRRSISETVGDTTYVAVDKPHSGFRVQISCTNFFNLNDRERPWRAFSSLYYTLSIPRPSPNFFSRHLLN